jgi:hypothetical protein
LNIILERSFSQENIREIRQVAGLDPNIHSGDEKFLAPWTLKKIESQDEASVAVTC